MPETTGSNRRGGPQLYEPPDHRSTNRGRWSARSHEPASSNGPKRWKLCHPDSRGPPRRLIPPARSRSPTGGVAGAIGAASPEHKACASATGLCRASRSTTPSHSSAVTKAADRRASAISRYGRHCTSSPKRRNDVRPSARRRMKLTRLEGVGLNTLDADHRTGNGRPFTREAYVYQETCRLEVGESVRHVANTRSAARTVRRGSDVRRCGARDRIHRRSSARQGATRRPSGIGLA